MCSTFRRVLTRVVVTATAATSLALVAPADVAQAKRAPLPSRVIKVAASQHGTPYRWGGTSPRTGFDCSGYTRWVYAKVGKRLPRTSTSQYHASRRVPATQRRRGDLVFFFGGNGIYHVGLYAGRGRVWHAPVPGQRVRLERIWSGAAVRYGRVG